MQTDPIGYADGPNSYNYVHGNPVNAKDPSGTQSSLDCGTTGSSLYCNQIVVTAPSSGANASSGGTGISFNPIGLIKGIAHSIGHFLSHLFGHHHHSSVGETLQTAAIVTGVALAQPVPIVDGAVDTTVAAVFAAERAEGSVSLFRALGEDEAESFAANGGYSSGSSVSGKYFAFNLDGPESAMNFATNPFNSNLGTMTMTQVDVPESFLANGTRFPDPGSAGASIHFGDEFLNQLNQFGPRVIGQ